MGQCKLEYMKVASQCTFHLIKSAIFTCFIYTYMRDMIVVVEAVAHMGAF